jgi:hypothetical protein
VNLDRVATAEGDVRLSHSLKIGKVAEGAGTACGVSGNADGLEMASPNIAGDKPALECVLATRENFESFRRFKRGNEIDDGAEDANGITGFLETMAIRGGLQKASEARGYAGPDGHGQAIAGDGGSINPGAGELDSIVVNQEAGLEVVRAVEN